MELYTGIDLHSNNGYYAIVNQHGKRINGKKLPNNLDRIFQFLEPYKDDIKKLAVESTYNWYWLVDGLMDKGYDVVLANPAGMISYGNLKNTNDKSDAYWLAEMLRLETLPTGYIYPKEERPVRDMLRSRMKLVQQRIALKLSLQGVVERECGCCISGRKLMKLTLNDLDRLLRGNEDLIFTCQQFMSLIPMVTQKTEHIEKRVLAKARLKPEFELLMTMPGIGMILCLVIMLETGDINRFHGAGNYTSYCRLTKAEKTSNLKSKGKNNRKNGNKYLCWAYIEAVQHAKRYCQELNSFYQRKKTKSGGNTALATKATAAKYSKGAFHIMNNMTEFDVTKMF